MEVVLLWLIPLILLAHIPRIEVSEPATGKGSCMCNIDVRVRQRVGVGSGLKCGKRSVVAIQRSHSPHVGSVCSLTAGRLVLIAEKPRYIIDDGLSLKCMRNNNSIISRLVPLV